MNKSSNVTNDNVICLTKYREAMAQIDQIRAQYNEVEDDVWLSLWLAMESLSSALQSNDTQPV